MLNKIGKLIRYSAQKKVDSPPSLIFFVTSQCNGRCSHCFNWKNLNQRNDLSYEEIEELSRQLGRIDSLLISGGEPFLRKDLVEICRVFFENNKIKSLSIPTNGLLPTVIAEETQKILQIARKQKIFVNISLDGTERVHDKIRHISGAFRNVIETYRQLVKFKQKYTNLKIGVNITVSSENYQDLFQLITDLKVLTPDLENLNFSFLRGCPKDPAHKMPSRENLVKIYRHITRLFRMNQPLISKTIGDAIFKLKIKMLHKQRQILTCQAGRLMGVVDANGDVRLCELLPPIGNLRNASFKTIWQGKEAESGRKKITDHRCWCTHECFLLPTMLAHPIYYPVLVFGLLKNWLCAKVK